MPRISKNSTEAGWPQRAREKVLEDEGGSREPDFPSLPVILWCFVARLPHFVLWYSQCMVLGLETEFLCPPESSPVLTFGTHLTNVR